MPRKPITVIMKKLVLKGAFALACISFSPIAYAQVPVVTGVPLLLFQVRDIIDVTGEPHSPRRTPPARTNLPEIYYDSTSKELFLTESDAAVSLSYNIIDEGGISYCMGEATLNVGDAVRIPLSALPSAAYTLVVTVGGQQFEADLVVSE